MSGGPRALRGGSAPFGVLRGARAWFGPGGALLPAASGVAIGATFSPYGGVVLPFLAFAPLGAALAAEVRPGLSVGAAAPGAAPSMAPFAQGFTAAIIGHGMGLYWMIPALAWRTALAVPVYVAVVCLVGMLAGGACQGAATLHRRWRWPLPLVLAGCWTGSEWVAAHVPGFSYAWLNAGFSLAWFPALAAGSELLGARFLTFWTVAVGAWTGGVCASWVFRGTIGGQGAKKVHAGSGSGRASQRALRSTAMALAMAALPAVAGHVRQATLRDTDPVSRVAAVQPGRDVSDLGDWLEPLRDARAAGDVDLVVFPERFLAANLRDPGSGEATEAGASVASLAEALGSAILVGAMDVELESSSAADTLWYNAAFLQPAGGSLSRAYRKVRLVPGLEGSGWWPGSSGRGYAVGPAARPLVQGGHRVGALVCYDSAFGGTARALVRGGAEWLAVLSNDDWLDPASRFRVTWAYWQHATHGRLRAIENRVSLLQVGSTGFTFAVPPTGVAAPFALEPGAAGVVVLEASRRGGTTLFTRTGDLLGTGCLLVLVAGVVAGWMGTPPSFPEL